MWLALAVGNMLTLAALRLVQKSFVGHTRLNAFRLNWLMTVFGLPIFLLIVIFNIHQIEQLPASFWLVLTVVVVGFYPIVDFLYFKTIKANDLSSVLPLLGLIPVATLGLGWVLLGQQPTLSGTIGVLLISTSIYMLQFTREMHWIDPLKSVFQAGAAQAMVIISFVTALAAIGDKFAIEESSTKIYFALNSIGAFLVLLLCDVIYCRRHTTKVHGCKNHTALLFSKPMLLMGALLAATQLLGFAALQAAPVAGYAVGIRNLNLIIASIAALVLLREPVTRNKLFSYAVSAAGVILIAL